MNNPLSWFDVTKTSILLLLYVLVTYLGVAFRDVIIETDTAMLLLLLNIVSGVLLRKRMAYVITAISIVAFHFFVLPEHNSFRFQNYQHIITFSVMAFSGVFAVRLTQSQQQKIEENQILRAELNSNYDLASVLAALNESHAIAEALIVHLEQHFKMRAQVWLFSPQLHCLATHQKLSEVTYRPLIERFSRRQQQHIEYLSPSLSLHPLDGQSGMFGVLLIEALSEQVFNPILSTLISLSLARSEANIALAAAKEANQLEQMRNTLLAAVSHDLKTPLGSIIGSATTLSDTSLRLPEQTQQELLQSIAEEGYSLNRSLTKLLDISRYSIKTLIPKRDWVEPEEVIGSAIKRVEQVIKSHPINLCGDTILVSLDYTLIEQIIANLVENAAKYSPVGSEIDIQTNYRRGHFIIEIADRGCGVAPEDRLRIFERFYRSEQVKVKGTGLGLAICQLIVAAHNGEISVLSRTGGGSIFVVKIPCEKYELTDIYE
ncbi:sensor histidine kinase [Photobacterium kishitanii]|uniref:sensor histidine kinase n=1 Tax=Photobacterium kishitanii TaxID=318456 RepID=UPI0005D45BA7|nr:ATP-binding protein [Photobacterium kishitanii]KJG07653.1 ATPase [Photobacterium kishitanii]PSV04836.1 sensor histidine kinase [Photobacterium kishitanii]PSV11183.1 sensor histidine kinase [Photobacterium kishitanii]PSV74235.1 sensor histidine kinase [Photobacterium kishitanii]PSW60927.1 sensor histidine kinase [Photobacterium kishitanii]